MNITEFTVRVGGHDVTCLLAAPADPARVAARPAVLLSFSATRQMSLQTPPYDLTAKAFTDAGHHAVSFDLPNHGDYVNSYGEGLVGMWAAHAAGDDPLGRFIAQGRAVVDACLERGLAAPGRIFACGVSRGGYCALRLMAADARIRGTAALAPLVDWRSLSELAAERDTPAMAAMALDHWAAQLAGRAIYLTVGNHDHRVGTDCNARFALRLYEIEDSATPGTSQIEVYINDSPGHTLNDEWAVRGAQFLLHLCAAPAN